MRAYLKMTTLKLSVRFLVSGAESSLNSGYFWSVLKESRRKKIGLLKGSMLSLPSAVLMMRVIERSSGSNDSRLHIYQTITFARSYVILTKTVFFLALCSCSFM